ncbi:DEAD/DEAH box helicase [Candidatus Woesearchaeota archaeon]|nr:DEAD/DEAH box helicase [Candidatus Woesearchaeota archaeon]
MDIRNFSPRQYQTNIIKTCKEKNTLVCIPTGLGKTKIGILLSIERLKKFPETKIIVLTPTKPLANQIYNEFKECTTIEEKEIILLTGKISPNKRKDLYEKSKIIVATPQTIQEDIENSRINLSEFSLLIIDEAHRSREKFANTIVAKEYIKKSRHERILALTASPGSTKSKIEEICSNLNIEAIEIRSETDEDVISFVQNKEIEYTNVELQPELKNLNNLIKEVYKSKIEGIKNFNINKPASQITKVDLLNLQARLQKEVRNRNNAAFYGLFLTAQLLKLSYASETLETQGLKSLNDFLKKLETEETKSAKAIMKELNIIKCKNICNELLEKSIEHPKIEKLKEVILKTMKEKENPRIIVFATYRNTVENLVKLINELGIKTTKLVGQKEGLTQKQQIDAIESFNAGKYNCLVATSIGEEGIHIGEADIAIFYDNTPSGIRKIQRSGRVGRLKSGKIIFLITTGTKDSAYFWKSKRDEYKMKGILYKMKEKPELYLNQQKSLKEF